MKAELHGITISYGKSIYKKIGENWSVLMWGTFGPGCKGIPSYKYVGIPEIKVPKEVKQIGKQI